jgi:hypothetical protein
VIEYLQQLTKGQPAKGVLPEQYTFLRLRKLASETHPAHSHLANASVALIPEVVAWTPRDEIMRLKNRMREERWRPQRVIDKIERKLATIKRKQEQGPPLKQLVDEAVARAMRLDRPRSGGIDR